MTRTPYTPAGGWEDYLAKALPRVPDDGRRDQARVVIGLCRAAGVSLFATHRRWAYWHGVSDAPDWLGWQTAGDWASFRLFCEHELTLTSEGKTVTT